jgi:uncharacterized membrane protein YphA (DoxX/SURF4 family)
VIWANRAAKAVLLIRILVGWVFLSEGIQKFLFPETLGAGRFTKIGIPLPQLMAPFIGVTEIICGALLLVGLFTRRNVKGRPFWSRVWVLASIPTERNALNG